MVNRVINILLLFFLFHVHQSAQGQVDLNTERLLHKYPGQEAVFLNKNQQIVIRKNAGKLDIRTHNSTRVHYLTERANRYLERSIFYCEHFSNVMDVRAATWIPAPKGSKMKKVNVENIYTRRAVMKDVFYDDYREKYFSFPSLQMGAVSELNYSEQILDPHFMPSFYFGSYIPIEQAEFTITHPEEVKVKYLVKDPEGVISRKDIRSRNTITTTFITHNRGAYPKEVDAPEGSHYLPHIIVYIHSYVENGNEVNVLPDLNALYQWYRNLMDRMKNVTGEPIRELADSLTRNLENDEDKIKSVFYWVQDHIKYIAFEDGLGGFIPRDPIETYQKKYGDCKDKATLINALLNYAGVPSYPTWIGTRHLPYSYGELPTPQVDNHMISAVKLNGQWAFLDGTSSHIKLGMPSSMIQGKEALIGISRDSFQVVMVPELSAVESEFCQKLNTSIHEGKIIGTGVSSFTGFSKEAWHETLSHVGIHKQADYLKKSLRLGNGKYQAEKLEFVNEYTNRDIALEFSYEFVIDDFFTPVDNKMLVNLNLVKPEGYDKIDIEKRMTDKVIDFKNTEILDVSFDIPVGYRVQVMPPARQSHDDRFGYSVTYTASDKKINMRREARINVLQLQKADFSAWNQFVDSLVESLKDMVVLEKIN